MLKPKAKVLAAFVKSLTKLLWNQNGRAAAAAASGFATADAVANLQVSFC